MTSVLFVCLGNICRSPTAHGVFQHTIDHSALAGRVRVDSAGTGAWHVGKPPDRRAQQEALRRGVDISGLRARQVTGSDFHDFDLILAMDQQNLSDLQENCPVALQHKLGLFLSYADHPETDVPDPYYGGEEGFRHVFNLVESASLGLRDQLLQQRR